MSTSVLLTDSRYYTSVFTPYLDSFVSQLKSRFLDHVDILSSFHSLFDDNFTQDELKIFSEFTRNTLTVIPYSIIEEFQLWRRKLKKFKLNQRIPSMH